MGEGPGVRAQWISRVLFEKWVEVSRCGVGSKQVYETENSLLRKIYRQTLIVKAGSHIPEQGVATPCSTHFRSAGWLLSMFFYQAAML